MAEETKSSSSSSKSTKGTGPRQGPQLAPVQGEYLPPGPPERTAGTPEHLGSDRPYEGGKSEPEAETRT